MQLKKLSKASVDFPSTLKEAVHVKMLTTELTKFMGMESNKLSLAEKVPVLWEHLRPWSLEGESALFDVDFPRLYQMDGSPADIGHLFAKIVSKDQHAFRLVFRLGCSTWHLKHELVRGTLAPN